MSTGEEPTNTQSPRVQGVAEKRPTPSPEHPSTSAQLPGAATAIDGTAAGLRSDSPGFAAGEAATGTVQRPAVGVSAAGAASETAVVTATTPERSFSPAPVRSRKPSLPGFYQPDHVGYGRGTPSMAETLEARLVCDTALRCALLSASTFAMLCARCPP